jgi:protocatechuate 3,4-dioxygenase beta subunit
MQLSQLLILGATSLLLSTAAMAQHPTPTSLSKVLPKNMLAINTLGASKAEATAEMLEAKDFKGVVVDELGEPLAGAVVSIIVGSNLFSTTTTTDAKGEYVITSTNTTPVLLVTYAGCNNIQQKAVHGHLINFQMEFIDNYERKLKKQTKTSEKRVAIK